MIPFSILDTLENRENNQYLLLSLLFVGSRNREINQNLEFLEISLITFSIFIHHLPKVLNPWDIWFWTFGLCASEFYTFGCSRPEKWDKNLIAWSILWQYYHFWVPKTFSSLLSLFRWDNCAIRVHLDINFFFHSFYKLQIVNPDLKAHRNYKGVQRINFENPDQYMPTCRVFYSGSHRIKFWFLVTFKCFSKIDQTNGARELDPKSLTGYSFKQESLAYQAIFRDFRNNPVLG